MGRIILSINLTKRCIKMLTIYVENKELNHKEKTKLQEDYDIYHNLLQQEIDANQYGSVYENYWEYCAEQCIKFPWLDKEFEEFLRTNEDKELYTCYGGTR